MVRVWMVAVAVLVAAGVAGCGGGGADDPLAGGPPPEDFRLQPGDRPVRFRLDTAVSEETKAFIVETLGWAHVDLGDSGPLTIHVYSDEDHFVTAYTNDFGISPQEARDRLAAGEFAFATSGGHIWIYLPNFDIDPIEIRRLTLYHEYFHTVQDWLAEIRFQSSDDRELSFVPRWMVEGCAEYLAVHAAAARGLVDEGLHRQLIIRHANDGGEALKTVESAGQPSFLGGSDGAYTVGYLGCERLAQTRGPEKAMHQFWVSYATLRHWDTAFAEAFGLTPAAFYAEFEAYRRTL
ncbi:MAG: hypothetical protein ACRD12_16060 [Acidimicrobiales bacterium]